MTLAERIVQAVIRIETAEACHCRFEGLAKRLAAYLDEGEADILLKASGEETLYEAFLYLVPLDVDIGIHGFRLIPKGRPLGRVLVCLADPQPARLSRSARRRSPYTRPA